MSTPTILEGDYKVDTVIGVRRGKRGRELLCRWTDYNFLGDTWEPEEHIMDQDVLTEFREKQAKKLEKQADKARRDAEKAQAELEKVRRKRAREEAKARHQANKRVEQTSLWCERWGAVASNGDPDFDFKYAKRFNPRGGGWPNPLTARAEMQARRERMERGEI